MSVTNDIAVNQILARNALASMHNRLVFYKLVDREHEKDFNNDTNGYAQGQSIRVNRKARIKSVVGNLIGTFDANTGRWNTGNFVEDPIYLTVTDTDQLNASASFTSLQKTLALTDEKSRIGEPWGLQLATDLEKKVVSETILLGGQYIKAAGNSSLSTKLAVKDLLKAQALLDSLACPMGYRDRATLIPAGPMGELSEEKLNLFTPTSNEKTAISGYVNEFAGSDIYSYNLLPMLTVPTLGTALVLQSAVTEGASSVSVTVASGDNGKVLQKGTIIEFDGFDIVNPETRDSVGKKYSFAINETKALVTGTNVLNIDAAAKIYSSADPGNRQNIVSTLSAFTASVGTTDTSTTVTYAGAAASHAGFSISGTGIPANATIVSVSAGVSYTISAAATATGTVTATITPTALPAAAQPLTVVGQGKTWYQCVMFAKEAYTAVQIPLTENLPGAFAQRAEWDGFSVRACTQTISGSDTVVHRFDVFGKGILQRDNYACRILVERV